MTLCGIAFNMKSVQSTRHQIVSIGPRGSFGRPRRLVFASAEKSEPDRRDLLLSGLMGTLVLGTELMIPESAEAKLVEKKISKTSLSAFQRRDLVADFQKRAENELKKVVTAGDAPAALRLLLHDAATYDVATKTGGVNGSIVTSDELSRPENKDLKSLVEKLGKARDALQATGPAEQKKLSWADTIVLAAKVTQQQVWDKSRAAKSEKALELSEKFGNAFDVRLGRLDSETPDASGRFPAPGSSPAEVQKFMGSLNVKDPSQLGGPLGKKAPFWERPTFLLWTAAQADPAAAEEEFAALPEYEVWKTKYDQSRNTTFRQDYEVDFVNFFNKLADLGASFDKNAYLYDLTIQVPDRL